jgi:hypothetical protein
MKASYHEDHKHAREIIKRNQDLHKTLANIDQNADEKTSKYVSKSNMETKREKEKNGLSAIGKTNTRKGQTDQKPRNVQEVCQSQAKSKIVPK